MRSFPGCNDSYNENMMSTLHKISQAGLLAALDNQSDEVKESIIFNHAVTGNWGGDGRIDFAASSGSSTGPFRDVHSFSFIANSLFGATEFTAIDLAFTHWNVGPSGLIISCAILTNPVVGFSLLVHHRQFEGRVSCRRVHPSPRPSAAEQRSNATPVRSNFQLFSILH